MERAYFVKEATDNGLIQSLGGKLAFRPLLIKAAQAVGSGDTLKTHARIIAAMISGRPLSFKPASHAIAPVLSAARALALTTASSRLAENSRSSTPKWTRPLLPPSTLMDRCNWCSVSPMAG